MVSQKGLAKPFPKRLPLFLRAESSELAKRKGKRTGQPVEDNREQSETAATGQVEE